LHKTSRLLNTLHVAKIPVRGNMVVTGSPATAVPSIGALQYLQSIQMPGGTDKRLTVSQPTLSIYPRDAKLCGQCTHQDHYPSIDVIRGFTRNEVLQQMALCLYRELKSAITCFKTGRRERESETDRGIGRTLKNSSNTPRRDWICFRCRQVAPRKGNWSLASQCADSCFIFTFTTNFIKYFMKFSIPCILVSTF
jgi:hypothetical protein